MMKGRSTGVKDVKMGKIWDLFKGALWSFQFVELWFCKYLCAHAFRSKITSLESSFCFHRLSFFLLRTICHCSLLAKTQISCIKCRSLCESVDFCTESNQKPPNKTTELALMGQPRKAGKRLFYWGRVGSQPRHIQVKEMWLTRWNVQLKLLATPTESVGRKTGSSPIWISRVYQSVSRRTDCISRGSRERNSAGGNICQRFHRDSSFFITWVKITNTTGLFQGSLESHNSK